MSVVRAAFSLGLTLILKDSFIVCVYISVSDYYTSCFAACSLNDSNRYVIVDNMLEGDVGRVYNDKAGTLWSNQR